MTSTLADEAMDIDSIRISVPNKGRISIPIQDLIERSGLGMIEGEGRSLMAKTHDPHVNLLYSRPIDIPEYVASGVCDLGITGYDMVMERSSDVAVLCSLEFGKASIVLAVPEGSDITHPKELDGKRVTTEFPHITREYFEKHGVHPKITSVSGACEITPYLGIADAITDIASSGATLRQNHLRIIDTVLETSTMLIAHRGSLKRKEKKITELQLAFESVIHAKDSCYMMMNVTRERLDEIVAILPGIGGPTVMDIFSDNATEEKKVAVHAVVKENEVYRLIHQLKLAGAKDILVLGIDRLIR
jgi:ATP phosphoribosyltransferase